MIDSGYDIAAYIIVGIAIFFVLRSLKKKLSKKKEAPQGCDSGCGGCATPCELKDIVDKKAHYN